MCGWNLNFGFIDLKLIYAREYKGYRGVDETGDPDAGDASDLLVRDVFCSLVLFSVFHGFVEGWVA